MCPQTEPGPARQHVYSRFAHPGALGSLTRSSAGLWSVDVTDAPDPPTPAVEEREAGSVHPRVRGEHNLTAADTGSHYDQWWDPTVEDQATDRAHRLGRL
jgi:hypothetical protein